VNTMSREEPAVTVGQNGLRGRTARSYDPGSEFIIDDHLASAEFTDGTPAYHGQYVVIADDTPNVGALTVHKPGEPNNTLTLQHYLLAVPRDSTIDAMTPAEFRCLYKFLGVTRPWVARFLNVEEDDVLGSEAAVNPVRRQPPPTYSPATCSKAAPSRPIAPTPSSARPTHLGSSTPRSGIAPSPHEWPTEHSTSPSITATDRGARPGASVGRL
jgi:hypothetical protein